MHGKTSKIIHNNDKIFKEIINPFEATRYHSLVIEKETIPKCFEIIAWTNNSEDDEIMGVKHNKFPIYGLQFHPESILTKSGKNILKNFLDL